MTLKNKYNPFTISPSPADIFFGFFWIKIDYYYIYNQNLLTLQTLTTL